jgi:mannose-6-phosphate isomerase-like protein (cupin superfamily)
MRLDPLQHHQLHLDATTDVAASHWPMNAWYAGAYDVEVGRRLTPVRVAGVPIVLYRRLAPSIRRRTAIRYGNLDDRGLQSPVHRAASIDYGIVLEGEITLVLDDSEVTLRAGDVAVQRGTDHAWAKPRGRAGEGSLRARRRRVRRTPGGDAPPAVCPG